MLKHITFPSNYCCDGFSILGTINTAGISISVVVAVTIYNTVYISILYRPKHTPPARLFALSLVHQPMLRPTPGQVD